MKQIGQPPRVPPWQPAKTEGKDKNVELLNECEKMLAMMNDGWVLAADANAALAEKDAEIERLNHQHNLMVDEVGEAVGYITSENQRLREALGKIAEELEDCCSEGDGIRGIVAQALAQTAQGGKDDK